MGSYQELQSTFYRWRKFYMPTNPTDQCDVNIDNKFIKYGDDKSIAWLVTVLATVKMKDIIVYLTSPSGACKRIPAFSFTL